MDEAALIEALKAGNEAAFAAFVSLYQKNVLNICYRFLLHRQDAEDIAQEVFVAVFHSIHDFQGQSKVSTWLYRIAVAKSLDEIKRRNRKKRVTAWGKLLGLEQIAEWIYGDDRPDTHLEEKEGLAQLLEVMNKLPENQRIALSLSKIEGYSYLEIAEIMGTTIAAVESLIYRAKQNLKSKLTA